MRHRAAMVVILVILVSNCIQKEMTEQVVQMPVDNFKSSNKSLNLENISEIDVMQTVQVGEYSVKIAEIERVDKYVYEGGWREKQGKYLIKAAEGHEFLIFRVEYEKLTKEKAEESIKRGYISPLTYMGIPLGWGDFRGIEFKLAYSEGYDINPMIIGGICEIDARANYTTGWRGEGTCYFYYKKEWEPKYLVLSARSTGIILIFPIGKSVPVAKIRV